MTRSLNSVKAAGHGPAVTVKPLVSEQLRRRCDPDSLGFQSTLELDPIDTLVGQERALAAIEFGAAIDQPGYNIFAIGSDGTGRHSTCCALLGGKAEKEPAPDDWVYVHNFDDAHKPKAMRLPAGVAVKFRDAMTELVDDLRVAIPEAFDSDDYREKLHGHEREFEDAQSAEFKDLEESANQKDIALVRTPMGFALAPVKSGEVIKPEAFNALPESERLAFQESIKVLEKDLADVLAKVPLLQKRFRDQVRQMNGDHALRVIEASLAAVELRFKDMDVIHSRLDEMRDDMVQNVGLFLPNGEEELSNPFPKTVRPSTQGPEFNRYLVNVMVANDSDGDRLGAPLVQENHPTLSNLIGRIEHQSQFGALVTDFMMIRPGALHQANGGYLVIDARKVLMEMFSWEALKRALKAKSISITSASDQLGVMSTTSLEPEPIPLKTKVVLIGDRRLHYLLGSLDPEFLEFFKVQVDFDDRVVRSDDNVALIARKISTISTKEELAPLDAGAVALVVEQASRLVDDAERLSLNLGRVTDLLRESDYWARERGRTTVAAEDVEKAIEERIHRSDLLRERTHEAITRDTILIDTSGYRTGQINGLSVLNIGTFQFGQPSRITARVRQGSGEVVDIERETDLGGSLHSKGVLILSSILSANYARNVPLSLWASIVFEQNYGGVDGDSASSAELYALLSAIAEVPVNQSLAVTGSVNQFGDIQPIGGVNEKIEGFFDVCRARGLTGEQGVLIPAANVKHLMLRKDVVDAVEQGKFAVYPVNTIAEGIGLLTGIEAGTRDLNGTYPAGSVNCKVEKRLEEFANQRRQFAASVKRHHRAWPA